MKISKAQQKEFLFILERENKKLDQIFSSIKIRKMEFSETFKFAESYYKDMKYFSEKGEHVKAFELQNYVWGFLDALAISKAIIVPKELQKYFKADF